MKILVTAGFTALGSWLLARWKQARHLENMTLNDAHKLYQQKLKSELDGANAERIEEVRHSLAKQSYTHSQITDREFKHLEIVFADTIEAADTALSLFGLRFGGVFWAQVRDIEEMEQRLEDLKLVDSDKQLVRNLFRTDRRSACQIAEALERLQELAEVDRVRAKAHETYARAQLFLPDAVLLKATELYKAIFSLWYGVREQAHNNIGQARGHWGTGEERVRIAESIRKARAEVSRAKLEFIRAARMALGKSPDPVEEVEDPNIEKQATGQMEATEHTVSD